MPPADIDPALSELNRLLEERGWSYYRAMVKFAWQLNWDSRHEPLPPPVESLNESQLLHLCALLETNVKPRR